jgi:hypothetical protein
MRTKIGTNHTSRQYAPPMIRLDGSIDGSTERGAQENARYSSLQLITAGPVRFATTVTRLKQDASGCSLAAIQSRIGVDRR